MLDTLASIGRSCWYWLALLLIGLSFEAVALFYQYVLDEMPCVLCIQMRLWVLVLIVVALLVLVQKGLKLALLPGHLLTVGIAAGMLERAWKLLGTERGFAEGECGFSLGLPAWFTPDVWFPKLFQVQTSCGYTPELLFGVTMAEALIVFSAVFLVVSVVMVVAAIARPRQ
jgi:disulfide bond formation protein DsbB